MSMSKMQMDNDRLDQELAGYAEKERMWQQQLKETEDRVTISRTSATV